MSQALIVGCGYTGTRLARRLISDGHQASGTTRSESWAAELEALGVRPLIGDLTSRETVDALDALKPEVVVYLAPPLSPVGDAVKEVMQAVASPKLEAFVYASSSSVYGDHKGQWVDETTPPQPTSESGEARFATERAVTAAAQAVQAPLLICRITGIYGPGRTLKRALQAGKYQLIRGHDTWVNRIHVDDLVSGLVAAWRSGVAGAVYNLADDNPHRASEFANLAADLHGLRRPDWMELEEARRRFGEARLHRKLDSKRVRNSRLKQELGVRLKYSDYRMGLPAAVEEERVETRDRRGKQTSSP